MQRTVKTIQVFGVLAGVAFIASAAAQDAPKAPVPMPKTPIPPAVQKVIPQIISAPPVAALPAVRGTVAQPVKLLPAAVPQAAAIMPYSSLLFSRQDMQRINSAARTYLENLARVRPIMQPQANASPQSHAPVSVSRSQALEHPQFYLALIAYHDAAHWSVWLNGHKYTPETPEYNGVRIMSADQNKARFVWKPKLFQVYEDRLPPGANPDMVSLDGSQQAIAFTLFPNQSFSAYSMTVQEGYLPPVRVEQFTTQVSIDPGTDKDKK